MLSHRLWRYARLTQRETADSAPDGASLIRATVPDARHRPRVRPAPGLAGLSVVFRRKGRAERLGENRARGARIFIRASRVLIAHGQWSSPSLSRTGPLTKCFASVPHATVLSACNSQRRHALGALTECLVSPHCWVLGPPTPFAGRRPFTTSRLRA